MKVNISKMIRTVLPVWQDVMMTAIILVNRVITSVIINSMSSSENDILFMNTRFLYLNKVLTQTNLMRHWLVHSSSPCGSRTEIFN